jgi:hypothetical protein
MHTLHPTVHAPPAITAMGRDGRQVAIGLSSSTDCSEPGPTGSSMAVHDSHLTGIDALALRTQSSQSMWRLPGSAAQLDLVRADGEVSSDFGSAFSSERLTWINNPSR